MWLHGLDTEGFVHIHLYPYVHNRQHYIWLTEDSAGVKVWQNRFSRGEHVLIFRLRKLTASDYEAIAQECWIPKENR